MRLNVPVHMESETKYIQDVLDSGVLSGDGRYTKLCHKWIEKRFQLCKCLLTTSGTAALEMAALLCDIHEGDEIIMPSYTFVSTANAFVLRGARIKFVDIRPDTMNMDENLIENAITEKTKAIVPVHYAGVACEMDKINEIAKQDHLFVIEDAAQAFMSKYKGKYCGSFGDFGCFSFHETKNYTMGEGGAFCFTEGKWIEKAEVIREKGTNRSKFFRGEIDKYSWVDKGSSYLPSDINAALLYAQLEIADEINQNRKESWDYYYKQLHDLEQKGYLELAHYPSHIEHNSHMFWIKTQDIWEREKLISHLKKNNIFAVFHYIPLHSASAGRKYGEFVGEDVYTTKESERILRLPLYYGMKQTEIDFVCQKIEEFYGGKPI